MLSKPYLLMSPNALHVSIYTVSGALCETIEIKKKHATDEAISTLTLCNELITLTNEKTQPFKPNIGK